MSDEWRDRLDWANFFRLEDAYDYGVEITEKIRSVVERAILPSHDAGLLAQVIYNALHSDHVEIGTFYGGSAILAALVKKRFEMHGKIYCVDPLEYRPGLIDDRVTCGTASTAAVMANAKAFGVEDRIIIMPKMSYPWPLEDKLFGTGYIDGDHWNGMPMKDWNSLRERVSYAVVFDDYKRGKPEVHRAVMAAANDPEWILTHVSGFSAILRRRE